MIDIHAHIRKEKDGYKVEECLQDMKRFGIEKRVISTRCENTIQKSNQAIANLVNQYPSKFIGCAIINPKQSTVYEDIDHALSLKEIKMIEFNSFDDGYFPETRKELDIIFQKIQEKKLPVKVFTGIGARAIPHQWEIYVKRFPKINFIFLHMGCFDYGYSCVDIVNRNKNAFIETSNQYEIQILKKAFSSLNKEKIIFGTSYPERFTRNAIEIFDLFPLSDDMRNAIMNINAESLLA